MLLWSKTQWRISWEIPPCSFEPFGLIELESIKCHFTACALILLQDYSHLDRFVFIQRNFWASNIYDSLSNEGTHEKIQHKDNTQRKKEKTSILVILFQNIKRVKSVYKISRLISSFNSDLWHWKWKLDCVFCLYHISVLYINFIVEFASKWREK